MKKRVLTILLIEDNPADAAIISEMLQRCGEKCILKSEERLSLGLERLAVERYDVVILDLGLPDSSGIDTLRKFREKVPGLPVIVLTGLADEELAESALSMGAQDYLMKGKIDFDALYRSLRYSVERKAWQVRLEVANRELEAFSYSVSHDLRSPLVAIGGLANRVARKYGERLGKDGMELISLILDDIKKMEGLIQAFLSLSRAGRQTVTFSEVNMERMVLAVMTELGAITPEKKISVQILPLPPARCDEALMRQVFANLLSNAIKFTRKKDNAAIEVGCIRKEDENIYYVKDNGAGFDMQNADELFGVFKRLHSTAEFEGTGIGLSTVRRIIERHGGRTWAEAKLGEGATFYFSLPWRAND